MKNAYAILQWFFIFVLANLILLPAIPISLIFPHFGFQCLRLWCRLSLKIFRIQVVVEDELKGCYPDQGVLFVTLNQSSLLETFIGPAYFPVPFKVIINFEFALIPYFGWLCTCLRFPILVRQWPSYAKKIMNRTVDTLRSKSHFWMSVEGKRSQNSYLSPYKKGAAILAINAQAQIVPIVFSGAWELMPYGAWTVKSGNVNVRLLRPLSMQGKTYEDRDKITQELWELNGH